MLLHTDGTWYVMVCVCVLQVSWYHNGVEVSQDSRYRVIHEGNFFCLDISPLSVSDEGPWKCVAENSSGQASSSSSLRVIGQQDTINFLLVCDKINFAYPLLPLVQQSIRREEGKKERVHCHCTSLN